MAQKKRLKEQNQEANANQVASAQVKEGWTLWVADLPRADLDVEPIPKNQRDASECEWPNARLLPTGQPRSCK